MDNIVKWVLVAVLAIFTLVVIRMTTIVEMRLNDFNEHLKLIKLDTAEATGLQHRINYELEQIHTYTKSSAETLMFSHIFVEAPKSKSKQVNVRSVHL